MRWPMRRLWRCLRTTDRRPRFPCSGTRCAASVSNIPILFLNTFLVYTPLVIIGKILSTLLA